MITYYLSRDHRVIITTGPMTESCHRDKSQEIFGDFEYERRYG